MKDETRVNHPERVQLQPGNEPLTTPIYQSVKFRSASVRDVGKQPFIYSRVANPTVQELERLLSGLQQTEDCIAVASGVAALSMAMMTLLKQGDHVIGFIESYKPTRLLIRDLMGRFGVTHTFLSLTHLDELEKMIRPGTTKLIFLESPTNPTLRIPDLDRILPLAKRHHILTVLDNTFAGFHNFQNPPFDIVLHSLTKFASGHGDVMGGAILGRKSVLDPMRHLIAELGPALDPHAAFLILRGMKTYFLRYERHCANALAVAEFLSKHPKVRRVLYPGLPSHPDHARAKQQLRDPGCIVTFEVKDGIDLFSVLDRLKIFQIAASLGSTESLAVPVELFYGGDLTTEQRKTALMTPQSIRLSVGIENVQDLIHDLEQAL